MHFDDRLGTVLSQPVSGDAVARIQYVQLLDLLGNMPSDKDGEWLNPGYERLLELSSELKPEDRARLLRNSGLRLRNSRLIGFLAGDDHQVSSAAINAAELGEDEWLDLIPALPVVSRGILRHRRDLGPAAEARLEQLGIVDRGLPTSTAGEVEAQTAIEAPSQPFSVPSAPQPLTAEVIPLRAEPQPASPLTDSGIAKIVRKIEAYRKEHTARQGQIGPDTARLSLGDGEGLAARNPLARFDFVTDARGMITEADSLAAPMLIGLTLPSLDGGLNDTSSLAHLIAARQPIAGQRVTITLAHAISGEWQIDAAPLFNDLTAHFTGYAGRARRVRSRPAAPSTATDKADRMRQMLHELRNPAGAIQMSSELIQQQLGGDVPHEYRAIAASIASDTALILAGFEELDRLIKLDAEVMGIEPGEADVIAAVQTTLSQIHRHTEHRQSGFALSTAESSLPVAVERIELDRLLWRLLAAIAGAAGAMEVLDITISRSGRNAQIQIALPARLRELDDDALYHAQAGEKTRVFSAGMFGIGFTLRLARAEARGAGGNLKRNDGQLILTLPKAESSLENISNAGV